MDSTEAARADSIIGADGSPSSPPGASVDPGNPPQKKTAVRKRTKTGCLTCRKRRIKCDEGKPTCNNCIKSKRQCEGYNQRLTFKEPLGFYPQPHLYASATYYSPQRFQDALVGAQIAASHAKAPAAAQGQGPLAMIAPKPPSVDYTGNLPLQLGHAYQGQPGRVLPVSHAFSPVMYSSPQGLLSPPGLPSHPTPTLPHTRQLDHNESYYPTENGHELGPASPHTARYRGSMSDQDEPSGSALPKAWEGVEHKQPQEQEDGYWQSDDEASMADSDEEAIPDTHIAHLESNELGIQVARRLETSLGLNGTQLRTFSNPAAGNILATYIPSSANSPLNDAQTAAIFWYFVNTTGPSMSLYERHPLDPSPVFQGGPIPRARRHIWTYIFPIIAFSHPALMQAMLALGSLQMAKCQGLPPTAAMKHYHLSLRRIAKNYQSPIKRTQPATLAATLLLGFYEVWNSDHEKWCRHMWGARAIIRELPLRRMTREILALKREKRKRELDHECDGSCFALHSGLEASLDELDLSLVSQITGQHVDYGESGHILNEGPAKTTRRFTELDIETYESLSDLYWWFSKMDVYQSILGGTRPFMEYECWTQCAPRAPFGRIDAVYGTFDHLMLLLGRLVTFASRDLTRKRKARQAEAMAQRGQTQGQQGPPSGPPGMAGKPTSTPSPPMFPGMMPSTGRFTRPSGFSPTRESSPPTESAEDIDIDVSTAAAIHEWQEIRRAFEVFRNNLGPDFAPLSPEHVAMPEKTPFGPAQMYRTFSIAGIWMNYYMGLIVLYRSMPSMPPVAMAAAGIAAEQTAPWAFEIARIAAGLCEDLNNQLMVSTLVGAACIESAFCLFVAGVQFRSEEQRHWLVRRLHHISRLTGWQSARQISDGCESAWIKAAQLGRGPPYESPPDLGPLYPDSIWQNPRRIDRRIQDLEANGRLVLARTEQAHYALGLLSVEQDLDRLDLVSAD
ncbi:fungal transcriptional regulatory-like protein [Echria macrotheca]|uniref:Fungal transcriptional regulatory-like protein n=1 Tax=Echria macrotheca TaxID=438768 RepID=A0AAJ0BCG8_9PEZI|nr:fungal transcriptional regulatory-like protein [Echria macrotheca]